MTGHRKKPFSGKAKKAQLQAKKARKAAQAEREQDQPQTNPPVALSQTFVKGSPTVPTSYSLDGRRGGSGRNKQKLSSETVERARLASMKPFERLPQTALEVGIDSYSESIDFPKRPKWDYGMNKEQVESGETEYFENWVKDIYTRYGDDTRGQLSWFEHNLEVWRQLWRVLEISDIVLVVMDIRHPLLHFPRALYEYVTRDLKRKIVGIFNKVDLVSEFTVFAWTKYFEEQFPELHIACFSCYPRDEKLIDDTKTYALKMRAKRPRKRYFQAQGVRAVLEACKDVKLEKKGVKVDWAALMARYDKRDTATSESDEEEGYEDGDDDSDTGSMAGLDDEFSRIMDITSEQVTPHHDYVTLGLVGHPNVGKSSLINSIMQRTVVSTSRTPGHTKHFQTIHLCENVRLCDSPGLVFPTLLPRALQVLSGMYPIAQVQEPYSVVQYLAERVPVEKILSLTPPDLDNALSYRWSAWSICEAYAIQRGFFTAQAARPDVYRAANTILRFTNDGRILMSFKPIGFFTSSKYEKLRVEEASKQRHESDEDEDHSEEEEAPRDSGKIDIQGGAFALLADQSDA
ncbi:P-loop containing nucleoside triphosphate hydrolase protein [Fennellomyces sp. T-0311]|nr:P-loop containing nucleoside triphosphate hydrolase protein [Fennellomyces sp. T-0311]